MNLKSVFLMIGAVILSSGVSAASGMPKLLGTFDDWTAYTFSDKGGKVCYMSTEPTKSAGKYKIRDDVFLFVTHRPANNSYDVVNVVAGYTYKTNSKPSFTVDKNKAISLIPHEDAAWNKDSKTDETLVRQMKKGSKAVLKGTSKRGTLTTDTFSLKGFSKAYSEIQKACGRE